MPGTAANGATGSTLSNGAPPVTDLHICINLADLPDYGDVVYTYPDRGPISQILLAGDHDAGIRLEFVARSTTAAAARVESDAAARFAAWAVSHATECAVRYARLAAAEIFAAELARTAPVTA